MKPNLDESHDVQPDAFRAPTAQQRCDLPEPNEIPPALLVGYLVEHELFQTMVKASYDDLYSRSGRLLKNSREDHGFIIYFRLLSSVSGSRGRASGAVFGRILARATIWS